MPIVPRLLGGISGGIDPRASPRLPLASSKGRRFRCAADMEVPIAAGAKRAERHGLRPQVRFAAETGPRWVRPEMSEKGRQQPERGCTTRARFPAGRELPLRRTSLILPTPLTPTRPPPRHPATRRLSPEPLPDPRVARGVPHGRVCERGRLARFILAAFRRPSAPGRAASASPSRFRTGSPRP
jgi:hypothetical protein